VLPLNVSIPDPYATEVQDLQRITNLRINFTKLHTRGVNLEDATEGIKENYYYAISEMIVWGSCSCNGHASRCAPGEYAQYRPPHPKMIHSKCECTHKTRGAQCEQCQDFYFDLPWKPAIGKETNACKSKCTYNFHGISFYFICNIHALHSRKQISHQLED